MDILNCTFPVAKYCSFECKGKSVSIHTVLRECISLSYRPRETFTFYLFSFAMPSQQRLLLLTKLTALIFSFALGVCAVDGLLYVIGGDDGSCNLATVEYYNPTTDKWMVVSSCMSTGRSYAGNGEKTSTEGTR